MRTPIRMSGKEFGVRLAPPMVGEHTEEILAEVLGYDNETVADLRDRGVI
jgi:crotonobetainyl-CoA:carnitine CoA-transferase CaiB-like acyl-CoA transferase